LCAPGFSLFDYYLEDFYPGETSIPVVPQFYWPEGAGAATGITWYAAMTNHAMSEVVGGIGSFTFGWHE
ncbi:hypothetical protein JW905_11115, partial [bacterium]|nr:hypothetical protein [candidate division CSSED10-310 bacterium]